MKRIVDFIISFIAILLLIPFMIPIIIILKLTGEHYIFYYQPRIGKNGKSFNIVKFSTMLLNSPNIGTGEITLKKDPRVFAFGRLLRQTKINEIPQILNIIKGDMSIVGPRPLTPKHFGFYTPEERGIIKQLKPGLTGVGAIIFRDEEEIFAQSKLDHEQTYRQMLSPYKAALEYWYLNNKSFLVDLKIIFLTLWVLLFKKSPLPYKLLKDLPDKPECLKVVT
jgi:lipopolysaccharide/colanic/teichoic acid biosynthesis glycosyltransferase